MSSKCLGVSSLFLVTIHLALQICFAEMPQYQACIMFNDINQYLKSVSVFEDQIYLISSKGNVYYNVDMNFSNNMTFENGSKALTTVWPSLKKYKIFTSDKEPFSFVLSGNAISDPTIAFMPQSPEQDQAYAWMIRIKSQLTYSGTLSFDYNYMMNTQGSFISTMHSYFYSGHIDRKHNNHVYLHKWNYYVNESGILEQINMIYAIRYYVFYHSAQQLILLNTDRTPKNMPVKMVPMKNLILQTGFIYKKDLYLFFHNYLIQTSVDIFEKLQESQSYTNISIRDYIKPRCDHFFKNITDRPNTVSNSKGSIVKYVLPLLLAVVVVVGMIWFLLKSYQPNIAPISSAIKDQAASKSIFLNKPPMRVQSKMLKSTKANRSSSDRVNSLKDKLSYVSKTCSFKVTKSNI